MVVGVTVKDSAESIFGVEQPNLVRMMCGLSNNDSIQFCKLEAILIPISWRLYLESQLGDPR